MLGIKTNKQVMANLNTICAGVINSFAVDSYVQFLLDVLLHPNFRDCSFNTHLIQEEFPDSLREEKHKQRMNACRQEVMNSHLIL